MSENQFDVPTGAAKARSDVNAPTDVPADVTRVDLRTHLPDAVCGECLSILYVDDMRCMECGRPSPEEGWTTLAEAEDRWLGHSLAGRWLVSKRLGKGATSAVYRVDSLHVPRRFALKIIDLHEGPGAPDDIRERARVEVTVVQSAENPHIVAIHEMLQPTRRHIAILMEYVEGRNLREVLRRDGPLPPRRVVGILRQLAMGLRDVHAEDVVHRDIKPSNVLIESLPSGEDLVRLTDFGIARPRGAREKTGGFIGTPQYASPEQVVGDVIDPRSDMYSMGALAFHLLTGSPLFRRDTYVKILRAQVSEEPPRLSDAGSLTFSDSLEGVVARMLRKRPTERPQNVDELIALFDELERYDGWDAVRASEVPVATFDDAPTHERRGTPRGHCMTPFAIDADHGVGEYAAMAGGRIVAATNREVILTTMVPRRCFRREMDFESPVTAISLNADLLLLGLRDGRAVFIDIAGDVEVAYKDPLGHPITAIATDAAHHVVVVGTSTGDAILLNGLDRFRPMAVETGRPVTAVAVSSDGRRIAVARARSGVEVFDVHAMDHPLLEIEREEVTSLAFDVYGSRLATGQLTGMATVWSVPDGTAVHSAGRDRGKLLSMSFADETLLGLVREGEEAYVVDLECRFAGVCRPGCTKCHLQ